MTASLAAALVCCASCADDDATSDAPADTIAVLSPLSGVDWANAAVPAAACGGEGTVQLEDGFAVVSSARWPDDWNSTMPSVIPSQVEISDGGSAVYGDIDGDAQEEAVVAIWCTNGGGTASGQLGNALVVFTGTPAEMTVLAILNTTEPAGADSTHAPYFGSAWAITEPGAITATELRYGPRDGTCCPTGEARTTWRYDGTTMVLEDTVVTVEPSPDGRPRD